MAKIGKQGDGGGPPVKHGIYKLLSTGALPKSPSIRGLRKLKKALALIESDLITQLGGPEKISAAEFMLLQDFMKAKSVTSLIELFINQHGIWDFRSVNIRKQLDLHPVMNRAYLQYLRLTKDILAQLFPSGLGRKAEKTMDIIERGEIEYTREDEKEKSSERKKKKKD